MKKTTQVASDRAFDETKTVLPTEVARGVYVENPPGAEALKLMHLMIATAGGKMADDVRHDIRLADIKRIDGMRNHSRSTMIDLFVEMAGAVLVFDDTKTKCDIVGGFLDMAKVAYHHEISDDILVSWWFGRAFREMAEKSCHWAIIDRQTVFALSSKYAILLFQHVASLVNLDHVASKTFTVPELRSVLGVPDGKMERWNDVNRFALKPAISEINRTSRLSLTATPNKIGRTVASVTIAWEEKPVERKRKPAVKAVPPSPAPAAGRLAFPDYGNIKFGKERQIWVELAEQHAKRLPGGHLPDLGGLADQFRAFCEDKGIPLNGPNIEKTFVTFCKKYTPIMGGS